MVGKTRVRTYLDHNATAPLRPSVREALGGVAGHLANPTSVHTAGRGARRAVEDAREAVATLVGADPAQVVFTSGGTEANHLAWRAFQRAGFSIVTTAVEHPSVQAAAEAARRAGARVTTWSSDQRGALAVAPVAPGTHFVSVQHANGETGVVHPIERVAPDGALFHVDAVQTAGRLKLSMNGSNMGMLTLSGHKLGAPAGVGALVAARPAILEPLWEGGPQEKGARPGTENVLGIVGLGAAARELLAHGAAEAARTRELRDLLETGLSERIAGCGVTGETQERLGHVSHLTFDGVDGQTLLIAADLAGIDCSYGSACASGSLEPSPVLLAMGFAKERARSAIRFSLGWSTTRAEIERVLEIFPGLVARARKDGTE